MKSPVDVALRVTAIATMILGWCTIVRWLVGEGLPDCDCEVYAAFAFGAGLVAFDLAMDDRRRR